MSKGSLFTLVIINTYIPIFWKEPRVKVRPLRRYSPEKMPWLWSAIETSLIVVWNFERGLFIAIERWWKGTAGTIRKTRSSSKIIWERICGELRDSICANARATEGIRAWNARINCLEIFAIVRGTGNRRNPWRRREVTYLRRWRRIRPYSQTYFKLSWSRKHDLFKNENDKNNEEWVAWLKRLSDGFWSTNYLTRHGEIHSVEAEPSHCCVLFALPTIQGNTYVPIGLDRNRRDIWDVKGIDGASA